MTFRSSLPLTEPRSLCGLPTLTTVSPGALISQSAKTLERSLLVLKCVLVVTETAVPPEDRLPEALSASGVGFFKISAGLRGGLAPAATSRPPGPQPLVQALAVGGASWPSLPTPPSPSCRDLSPRPPVSLWSTDIILFASGHPIPRTPSFSSLETTSPPPHLLSSVTLCAFRSHKLLNAQSTSVRIPARTTALRRPPSFSKRPH